MLFPVGIMHPDAVGRFEILLLERIEEAVDPMLFRPEAELPPHQSNHDHQHDQCEDEISFSAGRPGIVRLGLEQGHGQYSVLVGTGLRAHMGRSSLLKN